MTVELNELRRTVESLAESDALSKGRRECRARQILEAIAAGATWAEVQEVTGLSPRGLALAISRGKKAQ